MEMCFWLTCNIWNGL